MYVQKYLRIQEIRELDIFPHRIWHIFHRSLIFLVFFICVTEKIVLSASLYLYTFMSNLMLIQEVRRLKKIFIYNFDIFSVAISFEQNWIS